MLGGTRLITVVMWMQIGTYYTQDLGGSVARVVRILKDASNTISTDPAYLKTLLLSVETWNEGIHSVFNSSGQTVNVLNVFSVGNGSTTGIGGECLDHTEMVIQAVSRQEDWALHMINSFGKPPSGLFSDKLLWLGDWDECLRTKPTIYGNSTMKSDPTRPFFGKYCSAKFSSTNQKKSGGEVVLTAGTCFPNSCSSSEAAVLLQTMIELLSGNRSIPNVRVTCQERPLPLDGQAIAVITVLSIILALMIVATVYDAVYVHWIAKAKTKKRSRDHNGVELKGSHHKDGYLARSPSLLGGSHRRLQPQDALATSQLIIPEETTVNGELVQPDEQPSSPPGSPINRPGSFKRQQSWSPTPLRQDSVLSRQDSRVTTLRQDSVMSSTSYMRQDSVNTVDIMIRSEFPEIHTRKGDVQLNMLEKCLISFSVLNNGTKALRTHHAKGALSAVHGIRFFSMTWIVIGNAFTTLIGPQTDNYKHYEKSIIDRFEFTPIFNAMIAVDTFFILSGLLVAYLSLKQLKKQKGIKNFNLVMFYFHRVLRLTPPYMLLLMTWVSLDKYIGDGPMWPQDGFQRDACRNSWWTNLLYINNLVKGDQQLGCFGWTWFLACDMQFYIISPLVFITMFYWPIKGCLLSGALVLLGAICSGAISMQYELPTIAMYDMSKASVYMWEFYVKPWCRIGPNAIGLLTGYLLYRSELKMKINRYINLLLWGVAVFFGLLVVYGLYSPGLKDPLTVTQSAVYNALARNVWAVCVCWVIFSCCNGYGGPINHILSWPVFTPLARINYFVYLAHQILMKTYVMSQRTTLTVYDYSVVYIALGHLFMAYITAFVFSLAFEAPVAKLEKALLGRKKRH